MFNDFKMIIIKQVCYVCFRSGEKVIKAENLIAIIKKAFTEVGTDKPGTTRDE